MPRELIAGYCAKIELFRSLPGTVKMKRCNNLSRNSGVAAYEIGADFLKVQFSDGAVYVYDYASTGSHNIEHMKRLAGKGRGLSSFISTTVREAYARKEP